MQWIIGVQVWGWMIGMFCIQMFFMGLKWITKAVDSDFNDSKLSTCQWQIWIFVESTLNPEKHLQVNLKQK